VQLQALYLKNFRNYADACIRFAPGLNIIHGKNASGKTNLLEAISLFMTGRSFRTPHLSDLISFGSNSFYLEAHFCKNGVDQVLKISSDGLQRKIVLNSTPLPTLSALLGILMGVILSPEDINLIKGLPSFRRQFLDLQIAKVSPIYLHHLSRYNKAMKVRNFLLRKQDLSTIDIWEEEMASSGAFVTLERVKVVEEIEKLGVPLQESISKSTESLQLRYKSPALHSKEIAAYLRAHYIKQRPREIEIGSTLTGPHKDDLLVFLQGKEARLFGSEGQMRSCVATLRLAEWHHMRLQSSELPLLCIDDIGISLDNSREESLYRMLADFGQVFVTSPKAEFPSLSSPHTINLGVCV